MSSMIATSFLQKPDDDDLKILTPWWDIFIKYVIIMIMGIAVATIAVQAARDAPVCLPVVYCSASKPTINSTGSTAVDVCSKVPNKTRRTKVLTTLEKDLRLHEFLNSACYESIRGLSLYYPWLMFFGAFLLVAANNIGIVYPRVPLTMKHFVSLVTESYEMVGTENQIRNVVTGSYEMVGIKNGNRGVANIEQGNQSHEKLATEQSGSNSGREDGHLSQGVANIEQGNHSHEKLATEQSGSNSGREDGHLSQEDKIKIKSLSEKIKIFSSHHMNNCVIYFYAIRLLLQIIMILLIFFGIVIKSFCFKSSFKCSLADFEEEFPMQYDEIVCLRYIASFYQVVSKYMFTPLLSVCCIAPFCWGYYLLKRKCFKKINISQGKNVEGNIDVKGDMALLCFLLKLNQSKAQFDRFNLFLLHAKVGKKQKKRKLGTGTGKGTGKAKAKVSIPLCV